MCVALTLTPLVSGSAQGRAPASPAALGFSADRLARIDRVAQTYIDSGKVAGVVMLVLRHGQVAYARALGSADREAGRPMQLNSLFRIASQSKAITSVAVMSLVEEGKLRLSDPVSTFVPSLAAARVAVRTDTGLALLPVRRPITIHDLLTHTAGISYGTDSLVQESYRAAGLGPAAGYGWYFADKAEPVCTSIDRLGSLPIVAQPGEQFVYGYSTDILGCIVERVSGQPLDQFFQARIFTPLRMTDTWFYPPQREAARLTTVYSINDDSRLERAPDGPLGQGEYLDGPRMSFSGGAGLVSTARDFARFLQMLDNGGVLDGARILAPATVRLMTSDQIDTVYRARGLGFGLGFEILTDPGAAGEFGRAGRFSWGGAYGTNYWVDPGSDLVAVFMLQLLPRRNIDLGERFRTLVYQALVSDR
ncbi:MAG: serine hydrolase domain-containing protein [Gemmatimonadota bacterium]